MTKPTIQSGSTIWRGTIIQSGSTITHIIQSASTTNLGPPLSSLLVSSTNLYIIKSPELISTLSSLPAQLTSIIQSVNSADLHCPVSRTTIFSRFSAQLFSVIQPVNSDDLYYPVSKTTNFFVCLFAYQHNYLPLSSLSTWPIYFTQSPARPGASSKHL